MERTKGWAQGVLYWGRVMVIGVVFGFGLQFASAWTNPTLPAPDGNVAGPVNLSAFAQYKVGAIGFGGLVKAYLGIDANGQRITNVATPIAGTDAVNKDYVNAASGSGGGATGGTPHVIVAMNPNSQRFSSADLDKVRSFRDAGGLLTTLLCHHRGSSPTNSMFGRLDPSATTQIASQTILDSDELSNGGGGVCTLRDGANNCIAGGGPCDGGWFLYGIPFPQY